jgi:tetratricopeptide (TPR) repeat protein
MKKDRLILILFLVITMISGAVIFMTKAPQPEISSQQQSIAETNTDTERRINYLETLLADDPDNLDILVSLGNAYYDINEPQSSIEYYERALAIKPDTPPVLVDCGAMYRQLGRADKAIELFRKAIEIDPQLPQAYFNLGAVLRMEQGDAVGAALAWKKYLELDPNPDPQIKNLLENEIKTALGLPSE